MVRFPYTLARTVKGKQRWYVVFYCWHKQKNQLIRKRIYVGGKTVAIKQREAAALVLDINKKLIDGLIWNEEKDSVDVVNPEVIIHMPPDKKKLLEGMQVANMYFEKTPYEKLLLLESMRHVISILSPSVKPNTIKCYNKGFNRFEKWLKIRGLDKMLLGGFDKKLAWSFIDSMKVDYAGKTNNVTKGYLSRFFNMLIAREIIDKNPFAKIEKLPQKSGDSHEVYMPAQLIMIKNEIERLGEYQLLLMIRVIYYTFLRPREEAIQIRLNHIQGDKLLVRSGTSKNSQAKFVRIPKFLKDDFDKLNLALYPPDYYLFGKGGVPGPITHAKGYFSEKYAKILNNLGLSEEAKYGIYSYKHTGVCELYKKTKDIYLVKEQCRHSSIAQTETYLRRLGMLIEYGNEIEVSGF